MTLKKQGTFVDDEDFITMGNSPSRFNSSDDEALEKNESKLNSINT